MKNSLLVLLLLTGLESLSQVIEAESRPYQFEIDKILKIEGNTPPAHFDIQPYRKKIRSELVKQMIIWHNESGKNIRDEISYEEELIRQLEVVQPSVIKRVGIIAMDRTKAELFLIEEDLRIEIRLEGFEAFRIDVPVNEIEDFKQHFTKLRFEEREITFNQEDNFVITSLKIEDPVSHRSYYYQSDSLVPSPSFTISLLDFD